MTSQAEQEATAFEEYEKQLDIDQKAFNAKAMFHRLTLAAELKRIRKEADNPD